METTDYVEFKKTRDLGAIITDTFKFIRENWKEYFGTIVRIAGPALVLLILSLGYYMVSLGGVAKGLNTGGVEFESPEVFTFEVVIALFVAMISGLVFYVLMQTSSLYFIKSYIDNSGEVDRSEIISNVKQKFLEIFGLRNFNDVDGNVWSTLVFFTRNLDWCYFKYGYIYFSI